MEHVSSREELEHLASQAEQDSARAEEEQKEVYVERPKFHRVLAWILFVLVLIGIAFYYFWIFTGGQL